MRSIGFVGIGNMGWPMAARLVRAGFDVTVADAQPRRADAFVAEVGGTAVADVRDVGRGVDALVTMLPTSRHVAGVLADAAVRLDAGRGRDRDVVGDPFDHAALAVQLDDRGVVLVDCAVSGGVVRAETGDLSLMAGGDADAVARIAPVLEVMGGPVHHCGPVGAGHAMKALNNLVSAAGFLVGVEALLIGRQFGLDPARIVEVLNASTGMNNSTQRKFAQFVLSRAFDSGFGLDLMAKDLGIAADMAREAGVVAPFSALCAQLWGSAANVLGPGRDHTEMARFSEAVAGHELT